MKIQYISDIHLELLCNNTIKQFKNELEPRVDICVLAGDIGNPFTNEYKVFLLETSKQFKKTFIIAGNHEFYGNTIPETKIKIAEICDEIPNISFLDNSFEDYEGYRWVGTTLWTNVINPLYTINDTTLIKNFSVEQYNNLHSECNKFLNNTLDECKKNDIKSIVITHHLPIYELTHKMYRNSVCKLYSDWFNARLDDMVQENNSIIKGWIYGHTHSRSIQTHYGVNFYCNPIGYSGENNYEDMNMVCEIID